MKWRLLRFSLGVFLVLAFVSFSDLNASNAFAEAKKATLTLGVSTDTLSVDILPGANGAFGKSSDAAITVRTDNFTGYTLSIAANNNTTSLTDSSNHEIYTLNSAVSEATFSDSSGTAYNDKWGYKPSQYIDSSGSTPQTITNNTNFLPSPTTTGDLLDITHVANSSNNTYTLSIGARVSSSLPAGSYSNTYIIRAVSNNIVYSITYDENTEDTVNNMPSPNPQSAEIAGDTSAAQSYTVLSSATPTRVGYTFRGWCDVATTNDPITGNQTCGGTTYAANSNYGIDQTIDNTNITLHAIWEANSYTVALSATNATTPGSNNTSVTYKDTNMSLITKPQRVYTVSGFTLPSGNKADSATVTYDATPSGPCTSATNCKSTYTLTGWYETQTAANNNDSSKLIATNSTIPALQPSTTYTNATSQWTDTSGNVTIYAGWSSQTIKLPTITKTGYTCGWTTISTGATTASNPFYPSGSNITPVGNTTLYGVCSPNTYTVALNNNGGTGGSSSATATYDSTTLSTIRPSTIPVG